MQSDRVLDGDDTNGCVIAESFDKALANRFCQGRMEARHRLDLFLDAPGKAVSGVGLCSSCSVISSSSFFRCLRALCIRLLTVDSGIEKSRHLCLAILAQVEESDRRALRFRQPLDGQRQHLAPILHLQL